jgi:hypothetical protein
MAYRDDDTCPVCHDACDSEHPCYHCGTSGRRDPTGDERDREEEWREQYWIGQQDD